MQQWCVLCLQVLPIRDSINHGEAFFNDSHHHHHLHFLLYCKYLYTLHYSDDGEHCIIIEASWVMTLQLTTCEHSVFTLNRFAKYKIFENLRLSFTLTNIIKPDFTPRKACKSRHFEHFKPTKQISCDE